MRKILIGIGVLLVIGIVVLLVVPLPGTGEAQTATTNTRTAQIERTTLNETVEGSGSITAEQVQQLSFGTSGTVQEVLVAAGDEVSAGQVLARLDTTDLENDLELAQMAMDAQRLSYDEQTAPPTDQEIAQAEAQLASARSQLESAQNNVASTEDELVNSCSSVDSSQQTLDEAQATYDDYVQAGYEEDPTFVPDPNSDQAKALDSAQSAYDRAVAQCNIATRGSDSTSQLESAQASYEQAQASYDDLIDGPNEDVLLAAESALRQAEIKLAQAQDALDGALLVAPFDGVITDVSLVFGQSAGAAAISIADTSRLHVDVSVDELDVVNVAVGQQANITLEAFDSVEVPGTVASIAPLGTQSQGLVTYTVRVDLDSTNAIADAGTVAQPSGAAAQPDGSQPTGVASETTTSQDTTGAAVGAVPSSQAGGFAGGNAPGGFAALREVLPVVMQMGTVDEVNAMLAQEGGEDAFYAALADAGVSEDAITQIKDAGGPSVVIAMMERFSQAGNGQFAGGGFAPGGQTTSGQSTTDQSATTDQASTGQATTGQPQGGFIPGGQTATNEAATAQAATSEQTGATDQATTANQGAASAQAQTSSADLPIRLGMTADIEIVVSSLENVLVVPTAAIQRQGPQEYLMVDDGAGGQMQVPVTSGETVSGMTVVTGDVSEGQTVYYTPTTSSSSSSNNGGFGGAPGGGGFGIFTGGRP